MVEPNSRVSPETLDKLSSVSSATVLGLLAKRGYVNTWMEGVRPLSPGRHLVGRAVTLRFLPTRPDLQELIARGGAGREFNDTPRWDALEKLGPGDVLVADAMGRSHTSTGGDVVYSRVLTKGAAGIVTDGGIRDGHKVAAYGFPVFAGGSTPTIGEPFILPFSVNEPVQCGGVLVWPGDVLVGDDEGVVVLPSQFADEIADEALEHEEVEQALLDHVMEKGVSPRDFYPFNEDTKRLHEEWKSRQEG